MFTAICPSVIAGIVTAPASKSAMQRGCAAALLHKGITTISNPGKSNDDLAAIDVIQKLGAIVTWEAENLVIQSNGVLPVSNEMNCGESGLGIRMFTPLAALSSNEIIITGEGSLLNRPMDFFDEIFPQLSIEIQSSRGKLPIRIKGPLQATDITIDGSLSSQFLTGLLFAFGKSVNKPATITVNNLKSKPYIDLTLSVMKHFGYEVENVEYKKFIVSPFNLSNSNINFTVESDWSGGAFLLVAAAIAGNATILGLTKSSAQADKKILEALAAAGTTLLIADDGITVSAAELISFEFDATDCPDLFPPLVALAAYCKGTTIIQGASRLTHKESNRAQTLQEEFTKMGVDINVNGDAMTIRGTGMLRGSIVHSRHDHRIAMACAVAALKANGETIIQEAEAINKSYPDFYEHLKLLGANVSLL